MVKTLPSVKITLSYPLYACGFDPTNPNHLIVAGGGGAGRNGVGNKVSLLDLSTPDDLSEMADLELSANEDNVASLAVGPRKDRTLLVFAGVNSSVDDVKKGKNQHFRVLGITQPGRSAKSSGVKISEVARDALFVHSGTDYYQRLVRISSPYEGFSQLGAAATGFAKESQIAIFDVPSAGGARWKSRGVLELPEEAMDLDVVQTGPETYQLAYCDDRDIFTVEVSKTEVSEPKCVYTIPIDEYTPGKSSFKSLRYVTPGFLMTVVNHSQSAGVALHGYRLPKEGENHARLSVQAPLPKTVSKATGLAVRNISPPSSPAEKQNQTQFVVAVAGNDASISVYTMEHRSAANIDLLADLAPVQVLKSVHPSNITGLSFSSFQAPKGAAKTPEPSVKLASVGVSCTAVVHSIPLRKHIDKSAQARRGGPPRASRYVVALKARGESPRTIITLVTLTFLIILLVGQTISEAKGLVRPILGVNNYLPASWTVPLRKPRTRRRTIEHLLSDAKSNEDDQPVVVRHDDLGAIGPGGLPALHVGVHDEEVHGPATTWENLDSKEQELWRQRLKKTGHWVEDMGETIFKDVLFGEIGGAIGNIVGEAL